MASQSTNKDLEGFRFFNDRETPEKMKDIAKKELGETEELRKKSLQEIRTLIQEYKIACIKTDDFVLRFLRTKKFDVRRAFEALRNYAHQRASIHKRIMRLQPEAVENLLRRKILGFLPYRDADERLVFYIFPGRWSPSICPEEEFVMTIITCMMYAAEKESSQVSGLLTIFEVAQLSLVIVPLLLRHTYFITSFLFQTLPMRYKGFHGINETGFIHYCLRILEPFLPKKIKNRIVLHGETRDAFFQQFPSCIIPEDFDGTLGPLSNDHLVDEILDYLQKMKDEQRHFIQQGH